MPPKRKAIGRSTSYAQKKKKSQADRRSTTNEKQDWKHLRSSNRYEQKVDFQMLIPN